MDFKLHDRMSEFLKSTALSPPRRPGEGFDLLDVVVVDPYSKDPAKMIVTTDTNLLKHFATDRKIHRHNRSYNASPENEQRKSEEAFELTDELKSAIGVEGVETHAHGKHSSAVRVNLVISHEKSYSISGATFSKVEAMVKNNFRAIVKNAARFNVDRDRHWYEYYTGSNDVYFIAVITKIYHGSISVEESEKEKFGAGFGGKVKGVWSSLTEGSRSESNSVTSAGEGIVGVQFLCFPFRKTEEVGVYHILDPMHIHWLDENERRKLQRTSKRHSWSIVESRGDGQINVSGRFFENCKATITSYTKSTVSYAKQHVKTHDFRHVKIILMAMLALLLLVPIVDSLSTNSSVFHLSLGARHLYGIQLALEQVFRDVMTNVLRSAFS